MLNQIEMLTSDKIFFNPGELVKVRHELDYIPVMYVVEKQTKTFINKETQTKENMFTGIKCRWFDCNYTLQEAIFSTKDLIHV